MIHDVKSAPGEASPWSTATGAPTWRSRDPETPLNRFLGGSPLNVVLKLFLLSFVVGALLMWLDIRPLDVVQGVTRFVQRVWALGFTEFRHMGDYLVAGAMIVLPLWFIGRLLNMRSLR